MESDSLKVNYVVQLKDYIGNDVQGRRYSHIALLCLYARSLQSLIARDRACVALESSLS